MAIATATMRNAVAQAYGSTATFAALYTTVPGGSAGTEVTGGTYARKALTWSSAVNGTITATATFDVPAGVTVQGWGVHNAASAGYLDGGSVTAQAFATAGTYSLTLSFTAS